MPYWTLLIDEDILYSFKQCSKTEYFYSHYLAMTSFHIITKVLELHQLIAHK